MKGAATTFSYDTGCDDSFSSYVVTPGDILVTRCM